MKALSTAKSFRIIRVTDDQQVAQAIDLGITTENMNGLLHIASCKSPGDLLEHVFKRTRHPRKMVDIFHIEPVADDSGTLGKAGHQIADSLQIQHQFQTGKQFTGLFRRDAGNLRSQTLVEFTVQLIELLLTIPDRKQSSGRSVDQAINGMRNALPCESTGDGWKPSKIVAFSSRTNSSKSRRIHDNRKTAALFEQLQAARFLVHSRLTLAEDSE